MSKVTVFGAAGLAVTLMAMPVYAQNAGGVGASVAANNGAGAGDNNASTGGGAGGNMAGGADRRPI